MDDFIKDNPSYERDKYDEESINRRWKGNEIIFSRLSKLSYEELQILEASATNEYIKFSAREILKSGNYSDKGFSRKLSL